MTTATATLVGDTPGIVGYGGKVTVGSPAIVVVGFAVVAATVLATGPEVASSVCIGAVVVPLTVSVGLAADFSVSVAAVGVALLSPEVVGSAVRVVV